MKANEFDLPSRKEEAKINSRLQEAKKIIPKLNDSLEKNSQTLFVTLIFKGFALDS